MPIPVSATATTTASPTRWAVTSTCRRGSELDGVRHEVADHLADALVIQARPQPDPVLTVRQRDVTRCCGDLRRTHFLLDQIADVDVRELERQLPRLNLCDEQEVVHESQ